MRVTRRYWSVVALVGLLAGFAVILERSVFLAGAGALGAWLLAAQYRFYRETAETADALTVEQSLSRGRVTTDEPVTVTVDVALDRPSQVGLRVDVRPPVSTRTVGDGAPSYRVEAGELRGSTSFDIEGSLAGRVRVEPPDVTMYDEQELFEETVTRGEEPILQVEPKAPRNLHLGSGGERDTAAYENRTGSVRGEGIEPANIRRYVSGDNLSRIDWKATARLNYPHVREYERPTSRRTILLVDHGESMVAGRPGERKVDYVREVALTYVDRARTHGDPLSLYTVGSEGVTAGLGFGTDGDHYARVRDRLLDLEPTSRSDGRRTGNGKSSTQINTFAGQFTDGTAQMARTLRPYVAATRNYVRSFESDPLFSATKLHVSTEPGAVWTALFTDDENRTEVHQTVNLARLGGKHVIVFLTPSVLFGRSPLDDVESAYRRYRAFERFRLRLTKMDRVNAFEVAPGDRLANVLDARRNGPPNDREGASQFSAEADAADAGDGARTEGSEIRRGVGRRE